ncbi:MAG: hypothetical protein HC915_17130 [Anaerolineae bacterium]|nr:hypothetical protein [Anaerolineae bacterium]
MSADEHEAMQAAHWMLEQGFRRVYSLDGGLDAWIERGLPLCVEC